MTTVLRRLTLAVLVLMPAGCLFSEEAFDTMSANLFEAISETSGPALRCRCGGGCTITEGG